MDWILLIAFLIPFISPVDPDNIVETAAYNIPE